MIPVQRPYIGNQELTAIERVFESRWLGMGAVTKEFENALKEFLGVKYVAAVNSGTSALHIALEALSLQKDDEIIVPSLTFVASVQAILAAGAKPIFCDVRQDTMNMDVEDVRQRVTSRTKAVMPVHYGGTACQMDELACLAEEKNIRIVEDAAHAFGSEFNGKKLGSFGDITCFSFDPIKNITCGEGGAVVTQDKELMERVITKRNLGISRDTWSRLDGKHSWFYNVLIPGHRYQMSNINAAIGLEQLKRFDLFKKRKQFIVKRYDKAFSKVHGLKLRRHDLNSTFPFFYVVRVLNDRRNDMIEYLKSKNIITGLHYIPNHLHQLFADPEVSLPVSECLYKEIMTLPLYYEMTDDDITEVITAVTSFFKKGSGKIRALDFTRSKKRNVISGSLTETPKN